MTPPVTPVTPPVVPPVAIPDLGAVSAPFVKANVARYMVNTTGGQNSGVLRSVVQDSSGALSEISGIALTGADAATRNISGDASFAQGRWIKGTVTSASGNYNFEAVNASTHYVVYNTLTALPASGTVSCDAGVFTAPNYAGGLSGWQTTYFGTASGSGSLAFDASGAKVNVTIDTQAGGSSGQLKGSTVFSPSMPTAMGFTGMYLASGNGMQLMLGDGGPGRYLLVVGYKTTLANGANYQGVATFRCS
ncbi:hypothetical protein ACQ4WQ_02080 [Janthinobacterium sp. GB1R12]|uniref:hypothetical protein n=1 Tax=Janthinobacterium sp. GB1R12 TaxID=3424190 RepID=UPI003F2335F4